MATALLALGGLLVVAIVGAALAVPQPPAQRHAPAATQEAAQPAAPAAAPAPDPKGTSDTSCDSDLGSSDSIYARTYLTGETDLRNTGNVGIVVRVKFHWRQEAYPDVTAGPKTVRVPVGGRKVVRFRYFAGTFAGSTAPLDRWDSWQNSHGAIPCGASVHITDTYGAVRSPS